MLNFSPLLIKSSRRRLDEQVEAILLRLKGLCKATADLVPRLRQGYGALRRGFAPSSKEPADEIGGSPLSPCDLETFL